MWKKCEHGIWLVNHKLGIVASPPCGMKTCESCAKKRRKLIVMRIMAQITELQKTHDFWFYTVTPASADIWARNTRKSFQKGWELLRKRLNRRFRGKIYWVLAKEMSKGKKEFTNAPPFVHGHIIIGIDRYNNFIPVHTWELSQMCESVGLGYICMVGHEEAENVPMNGLREARYVGKYVTKTHIDGENGELIEANIPRAIAWSRNWAELGEMIPKNDDSQWELLNLADVSVHGFIEITGYQNMVQWIDDD